MDVRRTSEAPTYAVNEPGEDQAASRIPPASERGMRHSDGLPGNLHWKLCLEV
jgi:hypothetical protein